MLGEPECVPAVDTAATKVKQVPALMELSLSRGDVKEANAQYWAVSSIKGGDWVRYLQAPPS